MLWVFANVYRTFCTTDGYMTLLDVATFWFRKKKKKESNKLKRYYNFVYRAGQIVLKAVPSEAIADTKLKFLGIGGCRGTNTLGM